MDIDASALPNKDRDCNNKLSNFIEKVKPIASWQESGQAATPLLDSLNDLEQSEDGQPIAAAVLGLTQDAVTTFLAWLLDREHHVCKIIVPEKIGFVELLLQDRGYVVESNNKREEFDQVDAFVKALQDSDIVQVDNPDAWMNPLKLQMQAPDAHRGLRLLVPYNLGMLVKKPALLSLLIDRAPLVIVLGSEADSLSDDVRDVSKTLFEQISASMPLLIGEGERNPRWLRDVRAETTLEPLHLEKDAQSIQSLLFDNQSSLRLLLKQSERKKRLSETADLLSLELDQSAKSVSSRRRLQEEGLLEGKTEDARSQVDKIKRKISEDVDHLLRNREQVSKQAMRADGEIWKSINEFSAHLSFADIAQAVNGQMLNLSLHPATHDRLCQSLEQLGQRLFNADVDILRESLEVTREQASEDVARSTGVRHEINTAPLNAQSIWASLLSIAKPEIKYRGEMPRMTIFTRLGSARRSIMGVMMMGMILGGVGTLIGGNEDAQTLRTLLYAAMLPLFIIGFFWTYISGGRKEAEKLNKEIERMRDGVVSECRRAMNEMEREKLSQLKQYLDAEQKNILRNAEERIKANEEAQKNKKDKERQSLQERNRNLDNRDREIQKMKNDLDRVDRDLRETDRLLREWSRDLIKHMRE